MTSCALFPNADKQSAFWALSCCVWLRHCAPCLNWVSELWDILGYTRIRTEEYNKAQVPALTRRLFARSTSSGNQFWASPMRIAVESAIHLWPAAPKAAPTNWLSVFSLLASGITTPWFFAPWWTEEATLQLYQNTNSGTSTIGNGQSTSEGKIYKTQFTILNIY